MQASRRDSVTRYSTHSLDHEVAGSALTACRRARFTSEACLVDDGYLPYAPVRVLQGDADEEVSAKRCAAFVEKSRARGGNIEIMLYPGATHDFDDPGPRRQSVSANVAAKADALVRAQAFFAAQVQGLQPK